MTAFPEDAISAPARHGTCGVIMTRLFDPLTLREPNFALRAEQALGAADPESPSPAGRVRSAGG